MARYQPIQCETIDKTSISGWLYEVDGPAPAIIMSHGFNCVKEMTLPEVAEAFQSRGYNVLLYDARNVGESGGRSRNFIDPFQMAEDLSDIFTYVAGLPSVDAKKIALWGISFGAAVSGCCAAIDRRCRAVVMVCPYFSYVQPQKADKAYAMLIKDRVSQLHGNEPYSSAPFTSKGENPIGLGGAGGAGGLESYQLMKAASESGHSNFHDRIAFQTYHKLALFRPKEYLDMIQSPVMMIIPEKDNISDPEEQRQGFSRINSPKRKLQVDNKGHFDIVTGDGLVELIDAIRAFLDDAFDGAVE